MRIVVTGASGFIGSSLTSAAIDAGHQVLAIDKDFESSYAIRNFTRNQGRCEVLHFDLAEQSDFSNVGRKIISFSPDTFVHLAAYAGVRASVEAREEYIRNNVLSTVTSLELARRCNCAFALASTSSLYAPKSGPTNETDELSANHPYALSKLLSEQVAQGYRDLLSSVRVLRFFTVFGPFGRRDMMPGKLVRAAFSAETVPLYDQNMSRDWTFIDDLTGRILSIINTPASSDYEIINMGSGNPITLQTFIETFEMVSGRRINFEPLPTPETEATQTWAAVEALRSIVGELEYLPLEEALSKTWQWATSIDQGDL